MRIITKNRLFFFWLSAISYKIFSGADYAPRYVSALFGAGCVLIVFFAGRKFFCFESGIFAALTLATCLEFMALSRAIITDMVLTFFVTSSIVCFFIFAFKLSGNRNLFRYLSFLSIGFAFMSKGPLGIIVPGLVIFAYLAFCRDYSLIKDFLRPSGVLFALVVILPWYIISAFKTPGFLYDNLIYENVMRYFTNVHERSGNIFYYIPVILGGFFPWSIFLPFHINKRNFSDKSEFVKIKAFIVWACAIFIFFSLSKSKLPSYILSIYPPLAILAGKGWRDFLKKEDIKYVRGSIYGLIVVLLAINLFVFSSFTFFPDIVSKVMNYVSDPLVFSVLIFLNIWILALIVFTYLKKKTAIFVMLLVFIIALFLVGISNVNTFNNYKSNKSLALLMKKSALPEDEIIFYKFFKASFIYYSERKIKRIDHIFQLSYRLNNVNPANDEYYLFRKRDLDNVFEIISDHKLVKKGENEDIVLMVREKNNG